MLFISEVIHQCHESGCDQKFIDIYDAIHIVEHFQNASVEVKQRGLYTTYSINMTTFESDKIFFTYTNKYQDYPQDNAARKRINNPS